MSGVRDFLPENLRPSPEREPGGVRDFLGEGPAQVGPQETQNSLRSDPSFEALRDAQQALRDAMAAPAGDAPLFGASPRVTELSEQVDSLSAELTSKYGISKAELGRQLGVINNDDYVVPGTGTAEESIRDAIGFAYNNVALPTLRNIGEVGEFISTPQQVMFAAIESQQNVPEGAPREERLLALRESIGSVDYGKMLGPGFADDIIEFGELLENAGVKSRTAIRFGGLAGDVFADPLFGGMALRSLGKLGKAGARAAKATQVERQFDTMIRAGDTLERVLSPLGVAQGVKATTRRASVAAFGERAVAAQEQKFAAAFNNFLNAPVGRRSPLALFSGLGRYGDTTVGQTFFSRGQNPFQPGRDVTRGGAGVPLEFGRFRTEAAFDTERFVERANDLWIEIGDLLGVERRNNAFQKMASALENIPSSYRATRNLTQQTKDTVEALAEEAADSSSPLMDDEVMRNLKAMQTRGGTADDGIIAGTVGEELEMFPAPTRRSEDVRAINRERVRETARLAGDDPEQAVNIYDNITTRLMEADVLSSYQATLYEPMKARFYEEIISYGGDYSAAEQLWKQLYEVANDPLAMSIIQDGTQFVRMSTDDALHILAETSFRDLDALYNIAADVFSSMSTDQLNIATFFRSLKSGHMRRVFGMRGGDAEEYIERLAKGDVTPSTTINETVLGRAFDDRPDLDDARLLIQDYIERVSPTRASEQGQLITTENLIRHLRTPRPDAGLPDGMPMDRVNDSLATLFEAMNPQRKAIVDDLRRLQDERQQAIYGAPAGSTMNIARLNDARMGEEVRARLGRMYTDQVGMQEDTVRAARTYNKNKFVEDVERFARKQGVVYDERPPNMSAKDIVLLSGPQYRGLNGKYVHRLIKSELDNHLKLEAGAGDKLLMGANRMRTTIEGSWLAKPDMIPLNIAGGTFSATLDGDNPVGFLRDLVGTVLDAKNAGGLDKLPEFIEMGDVMSTGMVRGQLVRNIDESRLVAINANSTVDDIINSLSDTYKQMVMNPLPGSLKQFGKFIGLEGFQLSEDFMRLTAYRRALKRGLSKDDAYFKARNTTYDYSEVPTFSRLLSDTGLVPFIGFNVLHTGRIFNSIARRPAVFGAASRLPEAIWNATFVDEEIRDAYEISLKPFERDGLAIPIGPPDENGNTSFLPLGDLIPTRLSALTEQIGSSIAGASWLGGMLDGFSALRSPTGEGMIAERYGQQVIAPTAKATPSIADDLIDVGQHLGNSYLPAYLGTFFEFPAGNNEPGGLAPALGRSLQQFVQNPDDPAKASLNRHFVDMARGRPSTTLFDEVMSAFIRSTRPISINPSLNRVINEVQPDDFLSDAVSQELQRELTNIMLEETNPRERQRALREYMAQALQDGIIQYKQAMTILRGWSALQEMEGSQETIPEPNQPSVRDFLD